MISHQYLMPKYWLGFRIFSPHLRLGAVKIQREPSKHAVNIHYLVTYPHNVKQALYKHLHDDISLFDGQALPENWLDFDNLAISC